MRLELEVSFVNGLGEGRYDVWCGSTKFTVTGDAPAIGEKLVVETLPQPEPELVVPEPAPEPTPAAAPVMKKAAKKKGK